MIYLEYDEFGEITYRHNNAELLNKTKSELEAGGILLQENDIPAPDYVEGKSAKLIVDVDTKILKYEYFDIAEETIVTDADISAQILLNTEYLVIMSEIEN